MTRARAGPRLEGYSVLQAAAVPSQAEKPIITGSGVDPITPTRDFLAQGRPSLSSTTGGLLLLLLADAVQVYPGRWHDGWMDGHYPKGW